MNKYFNSSVAEIPDSDVMSAVVRAMTEDPCKDNHDYVLQSLAAKPLAQRSPAALLSAYRYLQRICLYMATQANTIEIDSINETDFAEEIDWMKQICAHTQYSPELFDYMERCCAVHVKTIRDGTIGVSLKQWSSASHEERADILQKTAQLQAENYSMAELDFTAPLLGFLPVQDNTEGAVRLIFNSAGHYSHADLVLNESLLQDDSPSGALLRLHHEMIHHMTLQMACAVRDRKIQTGHPLYNDALLRLDRLEQRVNADIRISSVYMEDAEEMLAYEQEISLMFGMMGQEKPPAPVTRPVTDPVTNRNDAVSSPTPPAPR